MKEIANGIRELHDIELTHRDIKPENILIKTIK
jgi:serine/threonine protein kinase